jgi:transposase-like protein/very-short-patch-repair endonuclease
MNKAHFEEHKQAILDSYFENLDSLKEVAKEFHTYPNMIRRCIIRWGYKLRDKGQAQSVALSTGRHKHPTKGTTLSLETKAKISEKQSENWKQMSNDEYIRRCELSKNQWADMSPEEKAEMARLGGEGIRRASKEGSKAENSLREELTKLGYDVQFHMKNLIPNSKLEVDLFIPACNTIIEIDGPAHFFPIWGEAQLQRHIKADTEKVGLALACGYVIIRVKQMSKTLSQKCVRDMVKQTTSILSQIKVKFPIKSKRLFEFEI